MGPFDLGDRVAIVTGASRGIGLAVAERYLEAGARVIISSRKAANIQAAAARLGERFPERVVGLAAHAGDPEAATALVEGAIERFGRLDVVVNNAATNPHFGPILTAESSHWDKILEVNVKGAFWLCRAAAGLMRGQGGGKIINMASVAGISPGTMMGVYSVSKAALIMLTKVLASELASDNIQVNAIAPGFVKTHFSAALWQNPAIAETIMATTPAGRMAEPAEVAGIAVYLAASASDFTTGAVFVVDGGFTL